MSWGFRTYLRHESGQVAITFALAALPLLALTTAAIDYSSLTKERAKISSALDAAVLAAANNNAITLAEKDSYAEAHFLANYNGTINLVVTPSVTAERVRLVASGELPLDFGNIVGIANPKLVEASAATLATENTICVLALSEDDDASIAFDRDMEFLASGCAVHSNSKSTTAILAQNNLSLPTASSFCAVGGISGVVEPHSKGECSFVDDPYAAVPPATEGICQTRILDVLDESSGASQTAFEDFVLPTLPSVNPLPFNEVMEQLIAIHGAAMFESNSQGNANGNGNGNGNNANNNVGNNENGGGIRGGNRPEVIRLAAELGAEDLYELLSLYDVYGGTILNCRNNPKPECTAFDNPYNDSQPNYVPFRDIVADIFEMSYGPLPTPTDVPDIVRDGLVELINGQLYSRNNFDNELVPLSGHLTGGDILLTPGTYCGGLTVDGLRVRFSAGDYIFKDGPLTFLNQSEADADRVTFGFKGESATLNIESGSSLTIRAATNGPRKGLAFMNIVDSSAPGNRAPTQDVNRIASGGNVDLSGTAYFPEQSLMISGERSHLGANSPAVGLIAETISFRGDRGSRVVIAVDHVKAGIPPIQPQVDDGVRLIE